MGLICGLHGIAIFFPLSMRLGACSASEVIVLGPHGAVLILCQVHLACSFSTHCSSACVPCIPDHFVGTNPRRTQRCAQSCCAGVDGHESKPYLYGRRVMSSLTDESEDTVSTCAYAHQHGRIVNAWLCVEYVPRTKHCGLACVLTLHALHDPPKP